MPPSAISKRPCRMPTAPVNAPFSWPNNSLSTSVGGSAAQLTLTSGRACRRLRSWIARANSSLPVPVGPSSRTRRVHGRDLRETRQPDLESVAVTDDLLEVVVCLDLFFQVAIVGLESCVETRDRGDIGPRRRFAPPAKTPQSTWSRRAEERRSTQASIAWRCRTFRPPERRLPRGCRRRQPEQREAASSSRLLAGRARVLRQFVGPRDDHALPAEQSPCKARLRERSRARPRPPWAMNRPRRAPGPGHPFRRTQSDGSGRCQSSLATRRSISAMARLTSSGSTTASCAEISSESRSTCSISGSVWLRDVGMLTTDMTPHKHRANPPL